MKDFIIIALVCVIMLGTIQGALSRDTIANVVTENVYNHCVRYLEEPEPVEPEPVKVVYAIGMNYNSMNG